MGNHLTIGDVKPVSTSYINVIKTPVGCVRRICYIHMYSHIFVCHGKCQYLSRKSLITFDNRKTLMVTYKIFIYRTPK